MAQNPALEEKTQVSLTQLKAQICKVGETQQQVLLGGKHFDFLFSQWAST